MKRSAMEHKRVIKLIMILWGLDHGMVSDMRRAGSVKTKRNRGVEKARISTSFIIHV